MKFILLILLSAFTQLGYSQIFTISTAHEMLTTTTSVNEAKKILNSTYKFSGEGSLSAAGNIAYNFETKDKNHYSFLFLYRTAFDRIGYIQFSDDIKQTMNYRNQFLNLDLHFLIQNILRIALQRHLDIGKIICSI